MSRYISYCLALLFLIALPSAFAGLPIVTSVAASNITATSATLNGTVNTNSPYDSAVSFDYGLTAGYGASLAATTGTVVSIFDNDKAVATTITGLACATTYHFRVSATSNIGTTNGGDLSFTTSVCPVCGSDSGSTATSAPSNTLCSAGVASTVTSGNSSYTWTCSSGANSASIANCSATRNYSVTTSVANSNGTVSASQNVAYNATPTIKLSPAIRYLSGPVSGTCGGTLASNSYTTSPVTGDCTVIASFVPDTVRNALFVNASTSTNKTSVLYLMNPFDQSGSLTATAYNEAGAVLGLPNAPLATLSAQQTITLTSAQLEAAIGFTPSHPTSKYRIVFNSTLPGLELINFVRDIATGGFTLGQPQIDNRPSVDVSTSTRSALFANASTSTNKTSVIRIINTSNQTGSITATAYNESGEQVGQALAPIAALETQQMLTLTSEQLEFLIGYSPSAPTAKYRIILTANLPGFELINFVRDNATGNLTLGQSQIDSRPYQVSGSSVRQALVVYASTNPSNTSVVRIINPGESGMTLVATAYNEAGSIVGTYDGFLSAQQIITFTSAQLESSLGYAASAATAKYRIVFTGSLPGIELINFIKNKATGNLTLAQAQIDDRISGVATSSTRNALLAPSSNSIMASQVLVINLGSQAGTLTATAYDETGTRVGTANAPLGTLSAQQTLTFSAAQLESALGFQPSTLTARYRIVFSANLPSFELVNYIVGNVTGNITLSQEQIN